MKKTDTKKPVPNHPWVASWRHWGPQGLREFGERQAARLAAAGKQRRVKVT